jgi:NADPH:quinone reductase-like Zn-dependent oxidoreductase
MKAVIREAYGGPEVLRHGDFPDPELTDDGVLVRVRAVSLNRYDWYTVTGTPYFGRVTGGLRAPKDRLTGTDFAGTVTAVGRSVTDLRAGDEVFGAKFGAWAEYVCATNVARKPAGVSFEEAAAVPMAGVTALQGLRDAARVRPGQRVLVNGASGGVGTFAVQVAALLRSQVTAVCTTPNVELAASLGAAHVVDYTRTYFTREARRYDVLFDVAGSRPWSHYRRVLAPRGLVVLVGGQLTNDLLGPLAHWAKVLGPALPSRRRARVFVAKFTRPDLEILRGLVEERTVTPVVDRTYKWDEIADALRYVGEGHARGKVVVTGV